jgi:hypothetical protein
MEPKHEAGGHGRDGEGRGREGAFRRSWLAAYTYYGWPIHTMAGRPYMLWLAYTYYGWPPIHAMAGRLYMLCTRSSLFSTMVSRTACTCKTAGQRQACTEKLAIGGSNMMDITALRS